MPVALKPDPVYFIELRMAAGRLTTLDGLGIPKDPWSRFVLQKLIGVEYLSFTRRRPVLTAPDPITKL